LSLKVRGAGRASRQLEHRVLGAGRWADDDQPDSDATHVSAIHTSPDQSLRAKMSCPSARNIPLCGEQKLPFAVAEARLAVARRSAERTQGGQSRLADARCVRYCVRMKTYTIRDARENLARLADLAEAGEPVRIARKGHATLVLVAERDFRAADRFFEQLDALRDATGGAEFERPAGHPTRRRIA